LKSTAVTARKGSRRFESPTTESAVEATSLLTTLTTQD
jgi:hypothetical protein